MSGFIGNFLSKLGGTLQGDLDMAAGKKVDGLDLSALARYKIQTGSYVGNSTDDREIEIATDFNAKIVLVFCHNGVIAGRIKTDQMSGNNSKSFATAYDANGIKTLTTNGFTVANHADINYNGDNYSYIAIGLE